ncbi:MAG: right-handed parallel beta-helix repeat-containing protein, partial [Candidatus Cloacimonetes bacterium]|nr:right-handed parallel beta-helix repeat-containing protein [Candidatus Cloacimonadota bacterium]
MRSISLVLIALFISAVGLNATIITVNWDGTGDFITIQEGINASSNGDTVLVYPGTYQETINYNGKSITVGSLFIITADSTYIEVTEISSTIFSYTVRFENCEDSTSIIKGLTLGINNSSHGIYCNNSSPIISDNIISTPNGCGIRCDSLSIPIIDNNIITHASRGIHLLYNSSPRIINNYFYENGTGIFIYNSSPLIEGNTISESGRAIQINGVSNPNIFNNYIINNHYGLQVSPDNQIEKIYINNNLITNCCIGIQCNSSHISIINNSILYNSYCGIYSSYQPEIINCIIWGNGSSFNLDASPTISHSCFEGEFPINGIDNGGNISRNPCFINTLSENYHLQMASPCMEAGTIDTTGLNLLEFDLDGNLRIQDGNGDGISIIDMGCYESDTVTNPGYIEGTVYLIGGDGDVEQTQIFIGTPVNTDSNGHYQITIGEGTYNITAYLHKYIPQTIEGISVIVGEITYGIDSYLDYYGNIITVNHDGTGNYLTIQEGINCAENGDTVLVYPGTYIENINYNGKSILVGSLFFTTQDITYISQTVIDGNQNGHCVEFINQEDSTAILIGFTISNGGFDTLLGSGGGIYCCNSSPIITNSIISNNITADYGFGGGIYCENSNISLSSVTLFENTAYFGGGIFFYNSNPSLSQVTIKKNTASYGGGISSEDYSNLNFDPVNRCNIFLNYAISGYDLYFTGDSTINVIVDTFTVLMPDEYYAYPIDSFTFDILNFKIEQVDQDLYVSPSGSDDNSGLTIESPLQTISWALAIINSDSTNPHTIHLASGTYSQSNTGERFPLNCRSYISLQGEGEDLTVLDGEGLSGILECINDSCFSIENMTLKSGNAHHGGGIHFCNSSPTLENIILSGNIADDYGGGIYCNNSDLSLSNVTLLENTANSGGGIYCDGSFLSIENATISENISSSSGGGIGCTGSAMVLTNITISRNISSGGGGIYCKNSSQNLTNVTINGNTASSFGGGIYYSYSSPSLTNVIITGNNASMGAGIFCSRGSSDLRNVTITNNTADNRGGGIMGIQSSQNLLNCIVWNNVPYEIYGIIDTITVNYS